MSQQWQPPAYLLTPPPAHLNAEVGLNFPSLGWGEDVPQPLVWTLVQCHS